MAKPTTSQQRRAPSRWLRHSLWGLLSLAAVGTLLIGLLLASLHSTTGTAWLLRWVPGLQVTQPHGGLLGDFSAQRVELQLSGDADDKLVLAGLRWSSLRIALWPGHGSMVHLQIGAIEVDRIDLLTVAAPQQSSPEPTDLRLPLSLDLQSLRVGELHATALGDKPLRELRARLRLNTDQGRRHRIESLSFAWDRLKAQSSASVATTAPLMLSATLQAQHDAPTADTPLGAWRAELNAQGPLARLAVSATLRAEVSPAGVPTLNAQATLMPFATQPLTQLQAQMQALDLAALHSALPITSLSGNAVVETSNSTQPQSVMLNLRNDGAGRWNEGRLPVRRATLELHQRAGDALALPVLDVQLGDSTQTAGRITGQGEWTAAGWVLKTTLTDVQPTRLDARLAQMQLSGAATLNGRGFSNPFLARKPASAEPEIELRATLAGQLLAHGPARDVRLLIDGRGNANDIELRNLEAIAGGAILTLSGRARQSARKAPWRVSGRAHLKDFDPVPWFPGHENSPWRRGPHRLNAQGEWDLALPQTLLTADGGNAVARLSALRGTASLALADSVLAGVPLSGSAKLRSLAATRVQTTLRLVAAGNAFMLDGVVDTLGSGSNDRWELDAQAPALALLAPALRLAGITALDDEFTGVLKIDAHATGRWPLLVTKGTLDARNLRAAGASVTNAQAQWQLGTVADAPAVLNLELKQASLGPLQIDSLHGQLQGTANAHTLTLSAAAQGSPPAWARMLQADPILTGTTREATLVELRTRGSLRSAGGSRSAPLWRGEVEQFELHSSVPDSLPWLRAQDIEAELQFAANNTPAQVKISAGRADVLGAGLSWDSVRWQAGQGEQPQQVELQAELEAVPVAPLLSRLQLDFGWGGDLRIAGKISLRSAPQFSASVVLQRERGDLTVTDEGGMQSLGLTDLRFSLDAQHGQWSFTQALAGSNIGVAAGAVTLQLAPERSWPEADTPIQGVLEAQVANLRTWGAWVPAGWRLSGQLGATASIAGRFGAPEFTGEIRGRSIGVRNVLEGVNLSEGELQVALQGGTARIERMRAQSGAGSLSIEGGASLGEGASSTPKARLQLTADKFQLLGRVDRRIVTSGQAVLQLNGDAVGLQGKFTVDEGLIDITRADAPHLSDDVIVTRSTDSAHETEPDQPTATPYDLALDLTIDLGRKLRLRGRGLDTGLHGKLKLTSPGGQLAVHGDVRTEGGTYAAYSQKLNIDRGVIGFNGTVENPRLDIEATRPDSDIRVGIAISGNALDPRVRLFSEPEMSDTDKLSYLMLGRGADGLGGAETALLRRAAMALLSGEGESTTAKLTKAIGLDEMSVRGGDGEERDTIVSLGKQLSRHWYVGYERGLNATIGTWQLIYRMAQRFTLRAQSGVDNSLDVIWTWRWQ